MANFQDMVKHMREQNRIDGLQFVCHIGAWLSLMSGYLTETYFLEMFSLALVAKETDKPRMKNIELGLAVVFAFSRIIPTLFWLSYVAIVCNIFLNGGQLSAGILKVIGFTASVIGTGLKAASKAPVLAEKGIDWLNRSPDQIAQEEPIQVGRAFQGMIGGFTAVVKPRTLPKNSRIVALPEGNVISQERPTGTGD